jgi:hypothetical protein
MYLNRRLRCVNFCLLLHNSTLTTISLRKVALSLALIQIRCCCSLLQVKHLKDSTHALHVSTSATKNTPNKEHYNTSFNIHIYPAMTAFIDQYSLPNIFFDIGQL